MKSYARILVAIAFVLGLAGAVKAEGQEGIIVSLPFKFVVDGKTLPAGTYTLHRPLNATAGPLTLTSNDNGTSVYLLPTVSENASNHKLQVSFQRAGGQNFLRAIQTPEEVFQFTVSQTALMEAAVRSRNNAPVSGGR